MTVAEALADVRATLARGGVPTPGVDAEWLVRHVLDWPRARLLTGGDRPLSERDRKQLAVLAERRAAREPLQLIIGTIGFRHLTLEVRPGVFIPRPETEVLAGAAIERCPGGALVVEPCTGSGAVACAVATEVPTATVFATDAADAAVRLARHNAVRAGADVDVRHGDLLTPVPSNHRGMLDVLVSNPPYLAESEVEGLGPEVVRWDPYAALVAGPTGHEVTDRLVQAAARWLEPSGWLVLEVAEQRASETARRCRAAGLVDVGVQHDLAGRDRIVVARRRA